MTQNYTHTTIKAHDDDESAKDIPVVEASESAASLGKKLEQLFFKRRSVYLWGVVEDKSAKDIVNKLLLLEMEAPGEEIKFYINSPGGSVTAGMVIYDTIQLIKSPVHTICMGMAASMGSILLSAGKKGKRFIFPHGEVMIHQPSLGGTLQGTLADLEIHAQQAQRAKELGAELLAHNCGKKAEQILKDFDRDYWMNAEQAIHYGIVDSILKKL